MAPAPRALVAGRGRRPRLPGATTAVRTGLVPAVLALLALVGACTTSDVGFTGNPSGLRVAVLGDSLTHLGTDQLRAALTVDHQVQIRAIVGLRIDGSVGVYHTAEADLLLANDPDIVVINLGTNQGHLTDDGTIDQPAMLDDYPALVERFRAADATRQAAGRPPVCVVGVTVLTSVDPSRFPGDNALAAQLNERIPTVVDEVADWDAVAEPFTLGDPHTTPDGYAQLAALERQAVDRCAERAAA